MNWKRMALCALVVFVAQALVAGILMAGLVDRIFQDATFFRPEGQEKLIPYIASRVLFVVIFTYLFARSTARSGWASGLRFGLIVWCFYSIPMTVGFWAFVNMPGELALAWIGVGLSEMAVGGVLLGLLYRPTLGREAGDRRLQDASLQLS